MDQLTESAEVVSGDTERAVRPRTAEELKAAVLDKLTYVVSKDPVAASQRDWFLAVAHATRDIVVERWIDSTNRNYREDRKRVYYLSLEFLVGRMLFDAMTNVGIVEPMTAALSQLGVDLSSLRRVESDAALGNGGPGRRARQWRPGPPGGLFHGQHGDPVDRRARLRHPLRQRAVPADHSQRLAAGGAGGLAPARKSLGVRAARNYLYDRVRRLGRGDPGRGRLHASCLASRGNHRSRRLRHAGGGMGRGTCQYASSLVGSRGRSDKTRRVQRRRLHGRAIGFGAGRSDLQGTLSERCDTGGAGASAPAGIFLR